MKFIGQVFYHFELREYVVITQFDGGSLTYHGEGRLVGHCALEHLSTILGPVSIDSLTHPERDSLLVKLCMYSNKTHLLTDGVDLHQFTTMDI